MKNKTDMSKEKAVVFHDLPGINPALSAILILLDRLKNFSYRENDYISNLQKY
jgi:hypothetical protein